MKPGLPVTRELVLLGGGHAHVTVLRRFGMEPEPGIRLTLVTSEVETPYSGMVPGLIAGHYTREEAHIDLRPLARFAGARLYVEPAAGLDLTGRRVLFRERPPLSFDLLSINVGSAPPAGAIEGGPEHAVPIRPIDAFLRAWEGVEDELLHTPEARPFRIAVVGGGAGGVELILSLHHRLRTRLGGEGAPEVELHLIAESDEVLPTHNRRVRRKFARILAEKGVRLHGGERVVRIDEKGLVTRSGMAIEAERTILATGGGPPSWIRASELETDEAGFVRVDATLRSTSHPFVFAAGDVASVVPHPRPRSGVVAVRQGPPLHRNLRHVLQGRDPRPFRPQKAFLSLISTGERYAALSRSFWAFEGRWVWTLKDRIDRRWMERWRDLPAMNGAPERGRARTTGGELAPGAMPCRGCGAKVGPKVLERVLGRLEPVERQEVLVGLANPDDSAVVRVPEGMVSVQSVDHFPAFVDDPWTFGRVTAVHALGDLWAMGAEPCTALAIATLSYGLERKQEEELHDLLTGAMEVFRAEGVALVGGHTLEGSEISLGFHVTGLAHPDRLLRKGGMEPGDRLILTKPLGTGTLLAADMRGRARGRWVEEALRSMSVPSGAAARCLLRHGATACTDVTGFGLAGHLVEMMRASGREGHLELETVPALEGALETLEGGIFSTLHSRNAQVGEALQVAPERASDPRFQLLFDPQTAGGLLAAVPEARADACLSDLRALGYPEAAIVGAVRGQRRSSRRLHSATSSGTVTLRPVANSGFGACGDS